MNKLNLGEANIMAGIPSANASLFRKMRFSVGDPAAYIELPGEGGGLTSVLILRDIEMDRARQQARADLVGCPADYAPEGGLSGDRETATAQAAAECLRRAGARRAVGDRSLPFIYVDAIRRAGIEVECDLEMGVLERRFKDPEEIAWICEAQRVTEEAVRNVCRRIAHAEAGADGVLMDEGAPLTAERLRAMTDLWFIERGYSNPGAIIACGAEGADCHNLGRGPIRTGEPVIIDIFPKNGATGYNGDCTRTVVHGEIKEEVRRMFRAVQEAKAAGIAAVRPGATGEEVHLAVIEVIQRHGFAIGLPPDDAPKTFCSMPHGTGHGVGLEVHEPPLLDRKGPELGVGDVVTIEPGLYSAAFGGLRLEDLVVVTPGGCENLNALPEDLDWRD